jgi:rubrerythrin
MLQSCCKHSGNNLAPHLRKNEAVTCMTLGILGRIALAAIVGQGVCSAAANQATLQNLQSAHRAESNAQARYSAFAEKADTEGYGAVASLFRAAVRSAQIQVMQFESSIRALGAVPNASAQPAPVRSTKENLSASARANEPDVRYQEFTKTAQKEGVFGAVSSFEYAQKAQKQLAHLFKDAARHVTQMKGGGRTYYVCSTSGFTVGMVDPMYCMSGQYESVK